MRRAKAAVLAAGSALFFCTRCAWSDAAALEGEAPLRFSGYLKTLYIDSHTAQPEDRPYGLSLSRARLKLDGSDTAKFSLHLEYDLELRLGNYLKTREFADSRGLPDWQYQWGAAGKLADGADYYLSQRLYRGYARTAWGDGEATLGRQRIALGTGRFWSALDLLNPDNPVRIEPDERIGVDALRVEYKSGSLTRWVFIAAPDPLGVGARQLGQFASNWQGVDVTLTGGSIRQDRVAGVDFATRLVNAGVHGEWVYTRPEIGAGYRKGLLGVDYGFVNGLTLSAEIFRSTQSAEDAAATIARIPQLPFLQPVGRRYLGASANYEPNPVYNINVTWLKNQGDDSDFASAVLARSIDENTSVTLGAQDFHGSPASEYGRGHRLYFTSLQHFF
jgi:hypothetical protein